MIRAMSIAVTSLSAARNVLSTSAAEELDRLTSMNGARIVDARHLQQALSNCETAMSPARADRIRKAIGRSFPPLSHGQTSTWQHAHVAVFETSQEVAANLPIASNETLCTTHEGLEHLPSPADAVYGHGTVSDLAGLAPLNWFIDNAQQIILNDRYLLCDRNWPRHLAAINRILDRRKGNPLSNLEIFASNEDTPWKFAWHQSKSTPAELCSRFAPSIYSRLDDILASGGVTEVNFKIYDHKNKHSRLTHGRFFSIVPTLQQPPIVFTCEPGFLDFSQPVTLTSVPNIGGLRVSEWRTEISKCVFPLSFRRRRVSP
jgi:hypothetical protein